MVNEDEENERQSVRKQIDHVTLAPILIVGICIIVLLAACGIIPYFLFNNWEERASFGDMFGGANALFSGLALAGVVYAILLQRRELQLQRKELEMTRDELRRTAEAQETNARLTALNFFPAITLEIQKERVSATRGVYEALFLYVKNIGNTPAYDIDVRIVGIYNRENRYSFSGNTINLDGENKVAKIEETLIPNERLLQITEQGAEFMLSDRLYYPIIPQRRGVQAMLKLLQLADRVRCLIQLRDIQGNNYHYLYTYDTGRSSPFELYLYSIEPQAPTITERLQFNDGTTTLIKPKSEFIERYFAAEWNKSAPIFIISQLQPNSRDKGVWFDT
jgi:hypothetical protein